MNHPPKPQHPFFNAGPTAKFPGWSVGCLDKALISRSHRSEPGLDTIANMFNWVRALAQLPYNFHIALTPGSATGAVEMLLWNLLGERPVDCLVHDVFSQRWYDDIVNQLALSAVNRIGVEPGHLPDCHDINFNHDVVLNWNGSTTGVRFPNSDFIPNQRQGLVIADVTSAIFCEPLNWDKLDAVAFSWQKGLGGEAAHGMIFINERVIDRLTTYKPGWPIPHLYSMHKQGSVNIELFKGHTLNTPSILCIEDFNCALRWALDHGGQPYLNQQTCLNQTTVNNWVAQHNWCDFMAVKPTTRSYSTHCLMINEPWFMDLKRVDQWQFVHQVGNFLEQHKMIYDCVNHVHSLPSFRLWGGPTIDPQDLQAALNCLAYAYDIIRQDFLKIGNG